MVVLWYVAVPGIEPGLPDSKSGVLTTTLYRRRAGRINDANLVVRICGFDEYI